MLPLFAKHCPGDERPAHAIAAAREWLEGKVKFALCKEHHFERVSCSCP